MRPFGELEAVVMDCLWERGEAATVREVLRDLRTPKQLAYTTVMTVMDNLYRKGQLSRQMNGRAWRYAPVRSRAEHAAALLREVLGDAGDRQEVLMHFVAELDPQSMIHLRAAVDAARTARGAAS